MAQEELTLALWECRRLLKNRMISVVLNSRNCIHEVECSTTTCAQIESQVSGFRDVTLEVAVR